MRKITEIIIHCSATPAGRETSVAEIDRWHRARGFKSIGYHYLIGLDGTIRRGRREEEPGAHCTGHNKCSIGVCYVGGCDSKMRAADTRTAAQRAALRSIVGELLHRYPGASVHGHNEFAAKACPCFDVATEFSNGN